MSGETKQSISGWTTDTVRALIDERDARYQETFTAIRTTIQNLEKSLAQRADAQDHFFKSAMGSMEKAVSVAEANSEKWRAQSNEWRGAMDDRERKFLTLDTFHTALANITKDIRELKEAMDRGYGLKQVESRLDVKEGTSAGVQFSWNLVITIISIAVAILALTGGFHVK